MTPNNNLYSEFTSLIGVIILEVMVTGEFFCIAEAANVTEVTIRNRYKKLRDYLDL